MLQKGACAVILGLLSAAVVAPPAAALGAASASFRNVRSSLDNGGLRKFSGRFRSDAHVGGITVSTGASVSFRNRDGYMAVAFQPARISTLTATAVAGAIQLQWAAPGNDGREAGSRVRTYVIKYSTVAALDPSLSEANFDAAFTLSYSSVPAVSGQTDNAFLNDVLSGVVRQAQEPYGVVVSTGAGGISLRWMPVTRYADGVAFSASTSPTTSETYYFAIKAVEADGLRSDLSNGATMQTAVAAAGLTGYRIYRATSPVRGAWSEVLAVSTGTLVCSDPAGEPGDFYHVRAENASGLSLRSVSRSAGTKSVYIVAPDDVSVLEVLAKDATPLEGVEGDPSSAYLVRASSHPEDLGGRVIQSIEFKAWKGGAELAPDFEIPGMGWLRLTASSLTASGLSAAAVQDNASVYWNSGRSWVQLYGKNSSADQTMNIQTKYFGRYQLRSVDRAGGFAFNQAGLSNRLVTPNGDGMNDSVVFTYDNVNNSRVVLRLMDLRGKVVVSDLPPGPVSNSKVWDGTAGGRPVPGGIYIYQIESEGKVYSGTVVIVK